MQWKGLTKERAKIQLYCELSGKLVPGADGEVEVDKDWVAELRKLMPWVAGNLYKVFSKPSGDLDEFQVFPRMRIARWMPPQSSF